LNPIETPPASRFLWAFAVLFIALGLGYSSLTPIFENSDETLHYPYVKYLADGRGLPLARPGELWNQEGTQPPLYYAIVAASTFWIDSDNLLDHLQRNPHWLFTEVRALINDNQNLVIHGPMDRFPYRGAALAIHIGRWWSLVFGLVTVVCTFLLAQHLFPGSRPLIITATGLTALNPQFIRVSSTVSNDSLSAALTTLAILLALKFTEPYRLPPEHDEAGPLRRSVAPMRDRYALLLGLLTGLALLAKLSSLTTLFLVGFILFWRLFFLGELHQSPLQRTIRWLAIIGGLSLLLTGWWFWRNYQLYGEWLATDIHLNLAGRGRLALIEIWALRAEVERAYWATFGWGQLRPPEWVFGLLFWLSRLGLIGLSLALIARLVQGSKTRPLPLNLEQIHFETIIILLLWAGLNLVLYLRWMMMVGSVSHTRLIFPAIAAISLLLALGWHALLPRRLAAVFSGVLLASFLALNVYSLGWLIYPAFRPGPDKNVAFAQGDVRSEPASDLNLTFPDRLKLIGGLVYPQVEAPGSARTKYQAQQGDVILVSAWWETLAAMDKNYSVAAVLLAPDGSVLARRETYPGLGLRPTRYLRPGEIFRDDYPLRLGNDVSEPIVARAVVSLFDVGSDTRAGFPALDAAGNEVTPVVGRIKIIPTTWPDYHAKYPVEVDFAGAIRLIGYDLDSNTTANPGRLSLYWESLAPVETDYVLFLHLVDAQGRTVAQADAPPTHNVYPTGWWAPGEVIAGSHALPASPAAVAVRLGLYDLASGQRLPISASSLPGQDNSVELSLP